MIQVPDITDTTNDSVGKIMKYLDSTAFFPSAEQHTDRWRLPNADRYLFRSILLSFSNLEICRLFVGDKAEFGGRRRSLVFVRSFNGQ